MQVFLKKISNALWSIFDYIVDTDFRGISRVLSFEIINPDSSRKWQNSDTIKTEKFGKILNFPFKNKLLLILDINYHVVYKSFPVN